MYERLLVMGAVLFLGCSAPAVPDAGSNGGGGGEPVVDGGTGGGEGADASVELSDAGFDGGQTDAGIDAGAGGTSCADAIDIPVDDLFYEWVEDGGYRTHVRFTLPQTEWITMDSTDFDNVDPAMSVFSADGATLIAANNDHPLQSGKGSYMNLRLLAGTYCVRLESGASWSGLPPVEAFGNLLFDLRRGGPFVSFEQEPNDSAATASPTQRKNEAPNVMFSLVGLSDSPTDVDVFNVQVPNTMNAVEMKLSLTTLHAPLGPGKFGLGSGLKRVSVKVTTIDGTVLGAWKSLDATAATTPGSISVPVPGSTPVLVFITRPEDSTPTANDFYQMTLSFAVQPPREVDDTLNNAPATAQVLPGTVIGELGAGDVDHYAVDFAANDTFSMRCLGVRGGSGVHGMWELLSPTLDVVRSETEIATLDSEWNDTDSVLVPTAGRYVFKVSRASQEANNPTNFYRCVFAVAHAP